MRSDHTVVIRRHHRSRVQQQPEIPSSFPVGRSALSVPAHARTSDPQKPTYAEKVKPRFIATINDPKYVRMREMAMTEGSFQSVTDEDLAVLIVHFRECAQKNAAKRKFVKADEFSRLSQEARDALTQRMAKSDDPTTRVAESQARLDDLRERRDLELQFFDDATFRMRSELIEKQETDQEAFERHWSEEMPNRYRKSSAQLLQLKQIEKALTIAGDYAAALDARQRIEAQERSEVELQQGQLDDDYCEAKQKFESDQAVESELFDRKREAARAELDLTLQRTVARQESRVNVTKRKDSLSRKARSNNKIQSVVYGTSFARVARERNFEIDASLPMLRAPTDRRRMHINSECARRDIVVRAPRAYAPTNEVGEARPVFETQAGKTQFMAGEDE
jgi:hypothetical protein